MSRRITDQIVTWFEESLDSHLLGDNATFDVSIVLTPQGPALLALVVMPSLVIGDTLQVAAMMPDPAGVSAEQVDRFVAEALEQIRNERSQVASQNAAQPSGLLVPGRG